jgi:ribosomal protein L37AE/L43A
VDGDTKKLRPLESHGAEFFSVRHEQAVGNCPFCHAEGKFYAHVEAVLWDCKRCGRSGNLPAFLEQIAEVHEEALTEKKMLQLAKHRGLPPAALSSTPCPSVTPLGRS